mmetsp:Transcript_72658/g.146226  ORF Transcript_72658/g.146226 Transcript_72658/m.146226 type:complete len:211 (-) Transcript_72658:390-1022(-)
MTSCVADTSIKNCLLEVMKESEDDEISIKKIRTLASKRLGIDLALRKAWVREVVHELISEHFTEPETNLGDARDPSNVPCVAAPLLAPEDATITNRIPDNKPTNCFSLSMSKNSTRLNSIFVQLDGDIDFQNDTGVVGRISVQKRQLTFDLKGHQYAGSLRPCATLMVVGISDKEKMAKVDTIADEFIELSGKKSVMQQMSGVLVKVWVL